MSVYQIVYMDKVPDSAVCNEAVKLTGKRGFKGLQGFVNGLLRGITRGYKELLDAMEDPAFMAEDPVKRISIICSTPELIVKSMVDDYGVDVTSDTLSKAIGNRRIFVRTDETLSDDDIKGITDEWNANGIKYSKSLLLDYAYGLEGADKLSRLEYFNSGAYTVQDVSSMMVAEMADIKAGDRILDMCAAPGGKSIHAACKLKKAEDSALSEPGLVISRDVSDYKVNLIEENTCRLHADNVDTEVWDATEYDESMKEWADVVIADVPCSGFGVIGRKPDIKYNLTEEGLNSIVSLQRQIIDNALKYVKSGGTLMFSTCTMRRCENDDNRDYILNSGLFSLIMEKQLFITDETDGFYIAKFVKN